jgi:hypothetical protein
MPLVLNGTTGVQDNSGAFVAATAVTASGTSVDFTSIPSWVKRITVMFDGVSTNGASLLRLRIGTSSGVETTGYNSACTYVGPSSVTSTSTVGFDSNGDDASSYTRNGIITLASLGSNKWALIGGYNFGTINYQTIFSGAKTLAGTLDRVRITTVNGTDAFDAGTINILYE